jgi:hypothetical protein
MKIPADIHAHVSALTSEMIDAGESGDSHSSASAYEKLIDYCESVAAEGRDHPFLWETLADFTGDDHAAIGFYLRALPLATAANAAEYAASICLALAERHSNLEEFNAARDYALQADAFARATDDLPLRKAISQFLLDHSQAADEA